MRFILSETTYAVFGIEGILLVLAEEKRIRCLMFKRSICADT